MEVDDILLFNLNIFFSNDIYMENIFFQIKEPFCGIADLVGTFTCYYQSSNLRSSNLPIYKSVFTT